jgi:ubiquinone/menaquinone biosynthesis C-methylase UbiE
MSRTLALAVGDVPLESLPPGCAARRASWGALPEGPFGAVVADGWPRHVPPAALQALLAPGGRLTLRFPSRRDARAAARELSHWLEPAPGAQARGWRLRPVRDGSLWRVEGARRGPGSASGHFDNLAPHYGDEIPRHLVEAYLERKLARIRALLPRPGARVLDLGCGMGEYARALAAQGAQVVAVDASARSVQVAAAAPAGARDSDGRPPSRPGEEASAGGPRFAVASATRLPFADGSFDLAYAINMLHHLKRGEQEEALREARRVLRPEGRLLVFEINLRNPLFRLYMRHVFWRTRRIDRGDEEFLPDRRLPLGAAFRVERVEHYTFLPDFLPRPLLRPARAVESWLERTPLRRWGIHYTAVLRPEAP